MKTQNRDIDRGLVLWYPMVEGIGSTMFDHSDQDNHGTITGATWGVGPNTGQGALVFDETNEADKVVYTAVVLDKDSAAVSLWVYVTGGFNGVNYGNVAFLLHDEGNIYNQHLGIHEGSANLFVPTAETNTNGDYWLNLSNATINSVPDGGWAHIAISLDSGVSRGYIDNLFKGEDPSILDDITVNGIGGTFSGANKSWYGGRIADVRIYDRPLSHREILTLYNMRRRL